MNQSVGFLLRCFNLSASFIQEDMAYDKKCYLNGHGSRKREESEMKFKLHHGVDDC